MPTLINCPYCLRTEIQMASRLTDIVLSEGNVTFTSNPYMCVDCSMIVSKFVQKGLRAFRAELDRLKAQRQAQEAQTEIQYDLDPIREKVDNFLESL